MLKNNCVTLIFTTTEYFEPTHILPSLLRGDFNSPRPPFLFTTPHHFPAVHISVIGSFLPPIPQGGIIEGRVQWGGNDDWTVGSDTLPF
jgi:hypothetical protein